MSNSKYRLSLPERPPLVTRNGMALSFQSLAMGFRFKVRLDTLLTVLANDGGMVKVPTAERQSRSFSVLINSRTPTSSHLMS